MVAGLTFPQRTSLRCMAYGATCQPVQFGLEMPGVLQWWTASGNGRWSNIHEALTFVNLCANNICMVHNCLNNDRTGPGTFVFTSGGRWIFV